MNWKQLTSINDLDALIALSEKQNILILKHSTRCSVSRFSLGQLEKNWKTEDEQKIIPYFLDLLEHRDISAAIEKKFGVTHQSTQVLLIRNGICFYSTSHSEIDYNDIMTKLK